MKQLYKTLSYCREKSTDIILSLCPMSNFQPHKKKKMPDEQYPQLVTPTMKKQQQQPEHSLTISSENFLPRKTVVNNCEFCHLYSLKQMIVLDDIDTFYPV